MGLDLGLVSLDFGLKSEPTCLDLGLELGLEFKDFTLNCDFQNNIFVLPLFWGFLLVLFKAINKLYNLYVSVSMFSLIIYVHINSL